MTQISKELVKAIQDNYQAALDMHEKNVAVSAIHSKLTFEESLAKLEGLRQAQADNEYCSGHECFFRRTGVRCSRCKI